MTKQCEVIFVSAKLWVCVWFQCCNVCIVCLRIILLYLDSDLCIWWQPVIGYPKCRVLSVPHSPMRNTFQSQKLCEVFSWNVLFFSHFSTLVKFSSVIKFKHGSAYSIFFKVVYICHSGILVFFLIGMKSAGALSFNIIASLHIIRTLDLVSHASWHFEK